MTAPFPTAALEPEAPCPACANREREVADNARHLAALLREDPRSRERYRGSLGLCLPHFPLAWSAQGADRAQAPRPSKDDRSLVVIRSRRALTSAHRGMTDEFGA